MRSSLQYEFKEKTNDNAYNKQISDIEHLKRQKKMQKHLINNLSCIARTVTK